MAVSFSRDEKLTLVLIAGGCFLLHLITNLTGAYGFFRDELYYIACSDQLAWGYVDQPPLSLFLLKLSRLLLGDSLAAIRIIPGLMHTVVIVITAMMVKEMGGRLFAVFLACLVVALSPIHLGMSLIYSMNSIDIVLWSLALYFVLKIINTESKPNWIWLGIVLGIGLLNKISVLFLGSGIFVGLLFTNRHYFLTRWPYLTGSIACLLFLPYIVWNLNNDFAHLEFVQNASSGKYSGLNAFSFIKDQLLFLNPISTPLWISGLLALFIFEPLKKYRIVGLIYLTAFAILLLNKTSKGEYLAPAYASLFAAAGVFVEQKLAGKYVVGTRFIYPALVLISSALLLPLVLPVLSVDRYITYSKVLGVEPGSNEGKELADLPQFYADMFGWQEKARDVATVFNTLSEDDKISCAIVSTNYGRCGAIDFFGQQYGLPKSIGTHNNYWIWGPRNYTGKIMIILGGTREDHVNDFESVVLAGVSTCTHCMPYENNVNIFICRGLKYNLKDSWIQEKHYD